MPEPTPVTKEWILQLEKRWQPWMIVSNTSSGIRDSHGRFTGETVLDPDRFPTNTGVYVIRVQSTYPPEHQGDGA